MQLNGISRDVPMHKCRLPSVSAWNQGITASLVARSCLAAHVCHPTLRLESLV